MEPLVLYHAGCADGHTICEERGGIAAIWWKSRDGDYIVSLRSAEDGPDVSVIAKDNGGGGHKHAAGYHSKTAPFPF